MKIETTKIEITSEEIAALVVAIQKLQGVRMDTKAVAQAICGKDQEAPEKTSG